MANIAFIQRLKDVDEQTIKKMEYAAGMHLRHAAISFKIVDYKPGKVTIQAVQEKSAAGNYFDRKRLIEIVHETFDSLLPGCKILVHAIPYAESPTSVVTPVWINKKMLDSGIKLKQMVSDTGLDNTQLSAAINGKKPISEVMRAMFYYYFMAVGKQ